MASNIGFKKITHEWQLDAIKKNIPNILFDHSLEQCVQKILTQNFICIRMFHFLMVLQKAMIEHVIRQNFIYLVFICLIDTEYISTGSNTKKNKQLEIEMTCKHVFYFAKRIMYPMMFS